MPTTKQSMPQSGWVILILCFFGQNLTLGMAFGAFGPLLPAMEAHFGITRAMATSGMAVVTLTIGLLSPLLGNVLQRIPVRQAMLAGLGASAIGYGALSFLTSFPAALAMYALIGAGVCVAGILGPVTLITRWFSGNRGRMLSIVNLPILPFVVPYVVTLLLPHLGRSGVHLVIAGTFLVLIPFMLLIREYPASLDAAPESTRQTAGESDGAALSTKAILAKPAFWLVSLAIGAMAGTGTVVAVHIVPFGIDSGLSLQAASGLLSAYYGAGIVGGPLFGWMSDKAGPIKTLILIALFQAITWWTLLQVSGSALYALAAVLGMCLMPIIALHGAAMGKLCGVASISRAMGLSYFLKLPFLFASAPLIALIYDDSGSYFLPFLVCAVTVIVSAALFAMTWAMERLQSSREFAPA